MKLNDTPAYRAFTITEIGHLAVAQQAQLLALFRRMGLGHMADDVYQDTIEKAIRSLCNFRGDCQPSSWLYRVAQTVALDQLRKDKRRGSVITRSTDAEPDGPVESGATVSQHNPELVAIARQRCERIIDNLASLAPSGLRDLPMLEPDFDMVAAARLQGTTAGALYSKVSRLRKKILAE